jgi:hypothetical protein
MARIETGNFFSKVNNRMKFQIRWLPHVATSSLHAAEALCRNEAVVDPKLGDAVGGQARELAAEMRTLGFDEPRLWRQLLCMAHQFENKRQLTQITLFRAFGATKVSDHVLTALAGRLHDLQRAYDAAYPSMSEELALRARPLREQWEARGPGILHHVAQQFNEIVVVPGADVLLVQPVRGGYGLAQLYNNTVRMEAVLANPEARLPEVVRLAWLFLQLNLDLPILSEKVHGERLPMIAALAMLPAVLEAAEHVELVQMDESLLATAMRAWHIPVENTAEAVMKVSAWWDEFKQSRAQLPIALPALDQMFA